MQTPPVGSRFTVSSSRSTALRNRSANTCRRGRNRRRQNLRTTLDSAATVKTAEAVCFQSRKAGSGTARSINKWSITQLSNSTPPKSPPCVDQTQGRRGLIAVLEDIQERYGYLPENMLRLVSKQSGRSLVDVYGVATFYRSFSLKPGETSCLCMSRDGMPRARRVANRRRARAAAWDKGW